MRRSCADLAGGGRVVSRHNRLLVAFHVALRRAARRHRVHPRLRAPVPQRSRPHPDHQGHAAAAAVHQRPAVHRGRSCRSASTCRGSTACGAADRASTISSPSSSAASSRSSSASSRRCTCRPTSRATRREQRGAFEVSQPVWAIFLVLNVGADLRVARAGARGARAPLARRHRPEADPDRRLRRARPPGRRQDPRAPRARLSDRRLRRRQGRRRSPRLPRPAAARHDRRGGRDRRRAKRSITSTSRCRPSSTCRCSS